MLPTLVRSESDVDSKRQAEVNVASKIPSAAEAWWQITAGNAVAVGWSDVGELKKQNVADLLLIKPDIACC